MKTVEEIMQEMYAAMVASAQARRAMQESRAKATQAIEAHQSAVESLYTLQAQLFDAMALRSGVEP
jgi:hypothetical protein